MRRARLMAFRSSYGQRVSFDGQAFGRRVAAARAWRGLEPKQVASFLGVSPEAINRWERGGLQRPPARGQLQLLAEVLEQPRDWLVEGTSPPWTTPTTMSDDERRRDDQDRLARRFDSIDDKLDDIAEQLRAIAASRAERERR
jgi:transcriptional regulator with XRE-family HTH domain